MKKIYALFMTLCLVISATAGPLVGTVKGSYPLDTKVVTSAKQLSLDATMQKAPAATQGMQYDATEGELIRYYNESDALSIDTTYASEGQLSIRIVASDNSDLLSLVLFAEDTVPGTIIPEGTYPITSEPAYGTAYASPGVQNGSVYPSFYGMLNSKGQILTPLYFLESGNVVVEVVDGNLKISIDAANSNNVPMTIVYEVGGKSEKVEVKGPLKYDATEADGALDVTYGADATVELTNGDGYSILTVASPDATNEVDLAIFYDAADPETVIPAGTYTIDESYTSGTVLASTGVNSQGQVSLSFYANLNASGQLVTPLYFLVSGTVEVTNVDGNLKVEVNAVNSNNVPIHIVYDATPAQEETTVPTNVELWEAFKPYYNEYYGLARADQPIDKVSTFASAKMQEIMTDAASEYKWLGDYVLGVAAGQGVNLPTDMAAANEGAWRWAVHAFFNATTGANGAAGTDFTEAGKPEAWGPYYLAAQKGTNPEPEYALEETVEISNLTTETLTVGEATYLQLTGRNDMLDSDVQLFLNNYTGEDKEYEVNVENSLMTFGGIELTVVEGKIAQATDPEKGKVYTGRVIASAEEEGEVMLVALDLVMYATPAVELVIEDAQAIVDETTGTLLFTATWTDTATMVAYPVMVTVAGFEDVDFKEYEGAQISELQIGDDDNWLDFAVANAVAVFKDGNAVALEGEYTSWATGATYYVAIEGTLPVVEESVEMVGVVKRAVQNGKEVIVLTHEENGTAHIYQVINGKAVAEISLEGVVPVDPENKGSYLAISDIAVTEDGKLVANNYVRNQFAGTAPESGYKLGTSYYYIWNDLAGAPAVWFTSQTTARSSHGDVGVTFALKGTSTNAQLLVTAVHNNNRAVRLAKYNIIDGQYVEPNIPGGEQSNDYYEYYGLHTTAAYYKEATQGKQFQLSASPLGEGRWFMDGELVNPSEFVLPAVGEAYEASAVLTEDLGNVYNGATYVTVEDQVLMVAPFANPDGQLVGVEILNITNGLEAAQYVDMVYVDEAVAATAAATAVEVVEGGLNITLVADNTIHTWFVEMSEGSEWEVYEDAITNLVIDYDNLLLIGGPSDAFQVEVVLGLGDYDRNTDTYQLLPESSISVLGSEATFVDGYASVDGIEQSATAVVHCTWNGMAIEFHLTMTAAPLEATKVVVENATVEIEKVLLFGDMYDYALKMTGVWTNEGVDYPVLVEVPVYYPEATEPSEIYSTVTVGGWGDNDPWLGFGEGTLTVTTVDNVVTATGIVENPGAGIAIDITISGTITPTGVENATVTVKPVKAIKDGQLIIIQDGVEYNAQGATLK